MEAEHSQLPWVAYFVAGEPITSAIQPGRRQDEWRIDPPPWGNKGSIVASFVGPCAAANSAITVTAVNAHAGLVDATRAAIQELSVAMLTKSLHASRCPCYTGLKHDIVKPDDCTCHMSIAYIKCRNILNTLPESTK